MVLNVSLLFQVMPLSGYFVSKLLNLPSHYAAGLILVACCPGGMSSYDVYLCDISFALSSFCPKLIFLLVDFLQGRQVTLSLILHGMFYSLLVQLFVSRGLVKFQFYIVSS